MDNTNEQINKIPPHNTEAEQSVLGSLMLDNELMIQIADILEPKDFYRNNHKIIYEAMVDLYQKHEPIDLLSVSNILKEKGEMDKIGGMSYLTALSNIVPTPAHCQSYAKIVRKKRVLRDLISISYDISSLGYQEDENIDTLLDRAEQKIFALSQQSLPNQFMPIKSSLEEAFSRIEHLHQNKGYLRGIPTGFPPLDNILAGFQKADLIILAARPSFGKTSLALNIASHIGIKSKMPIGIFSLEMSREQLVDRIIASHAMVDLWKLRTGKLSDDGEYNDFIRIRDAMSELSEAPIFIDDTASPNIIQIKTMARRLQLEHGLGMIVIDYLQLMQPRTSSDSMVQQITEVSRSLKALARELNIPVLAISQLSRAVEQRIDKKPRLSDLRESGSIEQDADVVMFIHRKDKYDDEAENKNMAEIIIAKHRNGPTGKIDLYFNANRATFETPTDIYSAAAEQNVNF